MKTAKEVVIVGGAKSAYDVAYAYAVEGVKVHLVVRENGNGDSPLLKSALPLLLTSFRSCLDQLPLGSGREEATREASVGTLSDVVQSLPVWRCRWMAVDAQHASRHGGRSIPGRQVLGVFGRRGD